MLFRMLNKKSTLSSCKFSDIQFYIYCIIALINSSDVIFALYYFCRLKIIGVKLLLREILLYMQNNLYNHLNFFMDGNF